MRRRPDTPLSSPYLSVIIPAYNEAERLQGSLERVVSGPRNFPISSQNIPIEDETTTFRLEPIFP